LRIFRSFSGGDHAILKCKHKRLEGSSCLGVAQTVVFSFKADGVDDALGNLLGLLLGVDFFWVQDFVTVERDFWGFECMFRFWGGKTS
jgi:hypothetical protein